MRVGYIQTSPQFGDKNQNFKEIERVIKKIKANLIVLPELFATGYTFVNKEEALSMAEDHNGETAQFLCEVAQLTNSVVVGGFIEKDGDKLYNSAYIVSNKEVLGIYRKIHLYFKEKLWFSPGDKPLKVFRVNEVNIGVMICFDWFFPETARTLALLGADIIICISATPSVTRKLFETIIPARAVENTVYFIYVNLVGTQENLVFWGGSQIYDPLAKLLVKAPYFKESVKVCDIDLKQLEFSRAVRPVLRDIKPEIYQDLYNLSRTHKLDIKK